MKSFQKQVHKVRLDLDIIPIIPIPVLILTVCTVAVLFMICCGACAIRSRRNNIGKNHNYKYSAV